jgi:hypothetical protein
MAAAATKTYDLEGIAEDIEDVIFDISPMETIALSTLKRKKASNITHQWLIDNLASASTTNAAVEGDDADFSTATAATMTLLGNICQISTKLVNVSRTADTVRKYGRAETFAYELAKKTKELKRDVEARILSIVGSTIGSSATARLTAGLGAMIGTPTGTGNRVIAGSATSATVPGYASGAWADSVEGTAGALTALTETHLTDALQAAWTDGGDASLILCGPFQKNKMATFAGASAYAGFYNPQAKAVQGAIVGAVSVYVSSFGEHKIVLSRYMPAGRVYCIDPEYASIAFLDSFKFSKLGKVGDGERGLLTVEYCTVSDNPNAHAQILSLSTS